MGMQYQKISFKKGKLIYCLGISPISDTGNLHCFMKENPLLLLMKSNLQAQTKYTFIMSLQLI